MKQYKVIKYSKKGSILLYTLIIVFVLMTTVFFYHQRSLLTQDVVWKSVNQLVANTDNGLEDALLKNMKTWNNQIRRINESWNSNNINQIDEEISSWNETTNWISSNRYGWFDSESIEQIHNWKTVTQKTNINTQIDLLAQKDIDKQVTDKFKEFVVTDDNQTSNKSKFIQSFTFSPESDTSTISHIQLSWWLQNWAWQNYIVPDIYVLMTKFPKNKSINFSQIINTTDKTATDNLKQQYWQTPFDVDSTIFKNFKFITNSPNPLDKNRWIEDSQPWTKDTDLYLTWTRTAYLDDIVSKTNVICSSWYNCFDPNYIYKIYLIFSINWDTENQSVPFKLEAFNVNNEKDYIALSDYVHIDSTAYYKQAKQRISITKSVANDILPFFTYTVYSKDTLCKNRDPSLPSASCP